MKDLPIYISIVFGLTAIVTVLFFYKAANNSKTTLIILLLWLILQAFIGLSGFYTLTEPFPPRLLLLILPPLASIAALFSTKKGRCYIDRLDLKDLTLLHTIRIPVEFVLLSLFMNNTVPQLMTFEGRNFDIMSGLTAPFVFYFGFIKKTLGTKVILIWNLVCLGLLINVVTNAVLSAPFPFQKFSFDQPNIAILYFPFVWLPCCVVPLVLILT
ncbi:MAG: hypothetical protein H0V61_01080 [Chitinophagales bacterium]|nr:hypothetical protein [Chitinophagales bacterium]